MALDGTNSGMIDSIGSFLNRGDMTAPAPDLIRIAEGQLNRDLRVSDMIVASTLTISTSSVALPADFLGMVSLELPAGSGMPMAYKRPEEIRALRQNAYQSTGTPIAWSVAGLKVETVPAPSSSFVCPMLYYGAIPPLASNPAGNWLSLKYPDIYLYGSLLASAAFLKDDARTATWGQLYAQAISDLMQSDGRTSFGHGFNPPYRAAAAISPPANPTQAA